MSVQAGEGEVVASPAGWGVCVSPISVDTGQSALTSKP